MLLRLSIVLILFYLGCENSDNQKTKSQLDSISESSSENIINSIGEVLSPEARKIVDPWEEFTTIEAIINEYYNISPAKALTNAQELSTAAQQLKDSIRVEQFEKPDLKIRLNVLYSTALRLHDMNDIPKISDEEIKIEVNNLIGVFSSMNKKLNNIIQQENLEKELKSFPNSSISYEN
ncbi:MAG: hypothetical protein QNJ57_01235 [Flavobacteriaceae bacterium]|nr:hypothetical protein [Flavobacteriaceae bacterium]